MPKSKSRSASKIQLIPVEVIEQQILFLRGHKVMLDSDLAAIYGVSTTRLNEQVKRNIERFPADFMFQLAKDEAKSLISQFATSKTGRGGRRKLPHAFTEHGAVMLASVLNSPIAVDASIQVVRAFVRLRSILAAHKELAKKLEALERKYESHELSIKGVFAAIRKLRESPPDVPPKQPIGFDYGK